MHPTNSGTTADGEAQLEFCYPAPALGSGPQRACRPATAGAFPRRQGRVRIRRAGRAARAMVLAVARNVLHHTQDAEDVFQATFLVLARRAGSVRKRGSTG